MNKTYHHFFHSTLYWLHKNLFSSVGNTVLTLCFLWLVYIIMSGILDWAVFSAAWQGGDRFACLNKPTGACWPFIFSKFGQFIYGNYPLLERWRPNIVFLIGTIGILGLLIPFVPKKRYLSLWMVTFYPVLSVILLSGNIFGLSYVETKQWGGLLVTLVIAITAIVSSLPLGVLLALGRRSKLPFIKMFSICFIELVRSMPLIMVLFMANLMFPLFLPSGVNIDSLLRCVIGVCFFSAAYIAEVIRGGLQAIPKGQYEASYAIGLTYWQSMRFVIVPQALKISIPGIVNTFIGLFKDTTLVAIVGIFDLLGIIQFNFTDSEWVTPQIAITGYVFAGLIFLIFCFSMSRYSVYVENRLSVDNKE